MAKSNLLRFHDVRGAYRLIGECRDLGNNPVLWYQRMFDGLCELVGAPATSGGQAQWLRPHRGLEATVPFGSGFDDHGRAMYGAYMRELTPNGDPVFQALGRLSGRLVTRTRRQLIADSAWYRSSAWQDYHRPTRIDDRLLSVYQISDGGLTSVLTLHRAPREREFSSREQRLLGFFHGELGPLIGRSLVSPSEPSPDRLSPRLRQTLACLLEGDSEKQISARLGLRPSTVHEYVTALYRYFGVGSRAQLLAFAIRRRGRDEWRQLSSQSSDPASRA